MEGLSRRFLFLTYYFPPQANPGSFRSLGFAKYLVRLGWQPIVLTPSGFAYVGEDPELLHEVPQEARVIRKLALDHYALLPGKNTRLLPEQKRRRGQRILTWILFPDSKVFWAPIAYSTAARLIRAFRPQLIFATLPPFSLAPVATQLGHRFSLPVVLDFRDPWGRIGMWETAPSPLHQRLSEGLLHRILRRTDAVITVNEAIGAELRQKGHPRVLVTPHGFDPALRPSSAFPPLDLFRVVFAGTFYGEFRPQVLFEALSRFIERNRNPQAQFDFFGESAYPLQQLLPCIAQRFVQFHGRVPRKEAVAALFSASVNWFYVPRSPGSRYVSKSKLADYLFAGRTILAVVDPESEAARILRDFQGVFSADPDRPDLVAQALQQLYHLWENKRLPPVRGPVEKFNLMRLTERLALLFSQVMERKKEGLA